MPMSWIMGGSAINSMLGNPLGQLFGGTNPPNVNTSGTQQTQLPPWYTAYAQGALGTAENLASQPYPQYAGQRLAGFTDPQLQAFSNINSAQGNWAPTMQSGLNLTGSVPGITSNAANYANTYGGNAYSTASGAGGLSNLYGNAAYGAADTGAGLAGGYGAGALGAATAGGNLANTYGAGALGAATAGGNLANTYGGGALTAAMAGGNLANQYGGGALTAASQPVQQWNQPGVASSWMSPYMSNVTNALQQQGMQNWETNVMPTIESQFIANGNPNSSANAAGLSVGAAQNQANINALISQALQAGYGTGMQGFQTGQGQQLQQQGLQAQTGLGAANTALGGGQLGMSGSLGAANTALSGGQLGMSGGLGAANTALGGGQLGMSGGLGAANTALGGGQLGVSGGLAGANTALGAGQLGANTALGAGGLGISGGQLGMQGGLGAASQYYGAAPSMQTLTYNDIAQMMGMGSQQQQLAQTGYNTAYQNYMNQVQWPMQQLSWANSIATGTQLPTSTTATGSAPLAGATYGTSPAMLGYAAYNGFNSPTSSYNTNPLAQAGSYGTVPGVQPGGGILNNGTGGVKAGGRIRHMARGGLFRASKERIQRSRSASPSPLMSAHGGH